MSTMCVLQISVGPYKMLLSNVTVNAAYKFTRKSQMNGYQVGILIPRAKGFGAYSSITYLVLGLNYKVATMIHHSYGKGGGGGVEYNLGPFIILLCILFWCSAQWTKFYY